MNHLNETANLRLRTTFKSTCLIEFWRSLVISNQMHRLTFEFGFLSSEFGNIFKTTLPKLQLRHSTIVLFQHAIKLTEDWCYEEKIQHSCSKNIPLNGVSIKKLFDVGRVSVKTIVSEQKKVQIIILSNQKSQRNALEIDNKTMQTLYD